jgi:hypothetical protein
MRADVSVYLDALWKLLLSPAALAVLGVGFLLGVLTFLDQRLRWVWLAVALWATSLAPVDADDTTTKMIAVLEVLRGLARPLAVSMLGLLVLSAAGARRVAWRQRAVTMGGALFLGYHLDIALLQILKGDPLRGALAVVVYVLLGLALYWGPRRWLKSQDQAKALLRAVGGAAALFSLGTLAQLLVDPSAVLNSAGDQRLAGTTGNAQHAAMLCAASLIPCLFLAADRDEPMIERFAWMALSVLLCVLLLWTGSRTGMATAVIGLLFLFRKRRGTALGFLAILGTCVFVALALNPSSRQASGHLTSVQNTRADAWGTLWALFLTAPLFGIPVTQASMTENSYLLTAARFGLAGLLPLLLAWVFHLGFLYRRWDGLRPELRPWLDLIRAGFVSMAVGALFEGYLAAALSFSMAIFYVYFSLAAWLADEASRGLRP